MPVRGNSEGDLPPLRTPPQAGLPGGRAGAGGGRGPAPDGEPLCWYCAPHVVETCISCGRDTRVSARTDQGPLCQRCARNSPLMFRDCRRCGAHGRLHHRRWCDRCYADDKIRELLPDSVVAADPTLAAMRERFLAADERRTLDAFRRNTTVAILREALTSTEPLSHELLDRLGTPGSTGPVRALLAVLIGQVG